MTKTEGFDIRLKILLNDRFKGNRSQFAKTVGVSEARLRSYEDGKTVPGADLIIRLAKVLEISCEWLLFGTESNDKYSESEFSELVEYLKEKDKKIESLIERNTILEQQLKIKKKNEAGREHTS